MCGRCVFLFIGQASIFARGVGQSHKPTPVQATVPQPGVETLLVAVLLWLAPLRSACSSNILYDIMV